VTSCSDCGRSVHETKLGVYVNARGTTKRLCPKCIERILEDWHTQADVPEPEMVQ
jgi:hypothetical protein